VLRILLGCLLVCVTMAMPAAAENAPGVTTATSRSARPCPIRSGLPVLGSGLAEMAYLK